MSNKMHERTEAPKARRGDLVMVELRTSYTTSSYAREEVMEYRLMTVTNLTREGAIKMVRDDRYGYAGSIQKFEGMLYRTGSFWLLPAAAFDVEKATKLAGEHVYPNSTTPRAFSSLAEAREALAPARIGYEVPAAPATEAAQPGGPAARQTLETLLRNVEWSAHQSTPGAEIRDYAPDGAGFMRPLTAAEAAEALSAFKRHFWDWQDRMPEHADAWRSDFERWQQNPPLTAVPKPELYRTEHRAYTVHSPIGCEVAYMTTDTGLYDTPYQVALDTLSRRRRLAQEWGPFTLTITPLEGEDAR